MSGGTGGVTLRFRAQPDRACTVVVEPWGSEFSIEAGQYLTVEITPDSAGRIEISHYEDSIVVWSSVDEPIVRDRFGNILPL